MACGKKETLERLSVAQEEALDLGNALYALKILPLLPVVSSTYVDLTSLANGLGALFGLMEKIISDIHGTLSDIQEDLEKAGEEVSP